MSPGVENPDNPYMSYGSDAQHTTKSRTGRRVRLALLVLAVLALAPSTAARALAVGSLTTSATSSPASDFLYRPAPQKPLQWKCGERKLYIRGFPSTWTALITAKVDELNTAIPGLKWRAVTGAVPANAEAVIEYRSLGTTDRGITQHTISPTLFKTVVVSINNSVVTSPTATASGITIMHELTHAAGLDHRDSDPDSATARRPRVGRFTGKLSPGDRAALLVEGCAR